MPRKKQPHPFHLRTIETPFVLTIFGASGDLAHLKIYPSLYAMALQKRLPKKYYIVGFGRTKMTRSEFQKKVKESIVTHAGKDIKLSVMNTLVSHIYYNTGQYTEKEDFVAYRQFLQNICKQKTPLPHITYFATPPVVFHNIIQNLGETRKNKKEDIRLVIEKPFGTNKKSAESLFHFVSQYFEESQFFLLDHYLGKSSVQSILNMRRANRVLSNIIRGQEVANIQITAFESVGVEKRISYFEHVGIVRDIIQSHLFQVLGLVTMNIPNSYTAKSLQREKNNIIESIFCPCDKKNIVIGQYASYHKQAGVKKDSKTETFAALRLFLDRQDWDSVPIYIRTGKKLHEKHTYVVIELKKFPFQKKQEEPNRIIIEFYPEPRISIALINYQEGVQSYQEVTSSASIACNIEGCLPEHADLLLDVLNKERMHFLSFPEIIASWHIIDHVTDHIRSKRLKMHRYTDGTSGPRAQHTLITQDGFRWYDLH
jgi:glucose-6-phosphate 1-dehydrogenase